MAATPVNRNDIIKQVYITDTNLHDYTNDSNFPMIELGNQNPPLRGFMLWVYNKTDQQVTITPITNIDDSQTYPDVVYSAIPQYTVAASDVEFKSADFVGNFAQQLALQAQFSTAPTKGYLLGYLYMF